MKCQIDGAYWSYSTQAEMEGLWREVDRIQPEAEIHQELQVPWKASTMKRNKFLLWCLIILFMMFSRQGYWSGLPFPSPVGHVLSELSTMIHLFWVALHGMAHSFIELDKAVFHMISLISFLWLWFLSVCPLMPYLSAYHLTGVSLTLDMAYLFPHRPRSLPWTWGISSQMLAAPAPHRRWQEWTLTF